jgi:hypothetical protein
VRSKGIVDSAQGLQDRKLLQGTKMQSVGNCYTNTNRERWGERRDRELEKTNLLDEIDKQLL